MTPIRGIVTLCDDDSTFSLVLPVERLEFSTIRHLLFDGKGDLWISTSQSLWRYATDSKELVEMYTVSDGYRPNRVNKSAIKRKNGVFVFGGEGGALHFDPSIVESNLSPPQVSITGIQVFNEAREMLGYERAVSVFEEVASRSPEEIIAHLRKVGETWTNGRAQDDDVTFVVMKVKEHL